MDGESAIIVIQQYDNSIDANMAKAKLDAYGVPCFLTEENFSNLYPSNNFITGGLRLHVFEQDRDRVIEILTELEIDEDHELSRCPRCHSGNVERNISSKLHNQLKRFIYTLFMTLAHRHRVSHCLDCDFEF